MPEDISMQDNQATDQPVVVQPVGEEQVSPELGAGQVVSDGQNVPGGEVGAVPDAGMAPGAEPVPDMEAAQPVVLEPSTDETPVTLEQSADETPVVAPETMTATEAPIVDAAEVGKTQQIIAETDSEQAIAEIAAKIDGVENILVALSNDPSVDEIAGAIGLALALDKMGKHATAIYSGETPNVLKFLEPEKTLEENADSLQDLIIALNKDKADHLRYKVDGEYVKIYITPYKTKLTEDDFSYSYGDYNVDLVIALNVRAAISLDNVLREHGRIMHDASAIDITTGEPGRFGEIEWSNPGMSSVSEMVTNLLVGMDKVELDSEIATALLAGIVGATERFKNEKTTPETMRVAGRLMEAGANATLIAENVTGELEDGMEVPTDLGIEVSHEPVVVPEVVEEEVAPEPVVEEPVPSAVDAPLLNVELMEELRRQQEEANKPAEEPAPVDAKDYGKMIDDALAELNGVVPAEPAVEQSAAPVTEQPVEPATAEPVLPMPSDDILPPPPAPEVNFGAEMPAADGVAEVAAEPTAKMNQVAPEMTAATPEPVAEAAGPAAADANEPVAEAAGPVAADANEFKIPGM